MRLIVYILVLLMFLPVVYAPDYYFFEELRDCNGARFCGDQDLECSYVEDGKCPEDFGDWNSCGLNNYGGSCTPCDLDCNPDCGPIDINVPNAKFSGDTISIDVNAYGIDDHGVGVVFFLYTVTPLGNPSMRGFEEGIMCPDENGIPVFSHTFEWVIEGNTCEKYIFSVEVRQRIDGRIDGILGPVIGPVEDDGVIAPFIEITSPINGGEIDGVIELSSDVECEGVERNPEFNEE